MKKSPKKEAILNTAEDLFYQHGFHAIGVKSILDQAGVAPMTMYYHFKSKEALISEILIRREARYFQYLEDEINKESGVHVYVDTLVNAHINWMDLNGSNGCLFLRAMQEYEGINEEISTIVKEHKKTLLNKIEGDLQHIHAPASLGKQIFIIIEGSTSMVQVLAIEDVRNTVKDLVGNLRVNE
ncbi:TetR/AcrR family transcriptional regulator [Oceanobacillus kapialis]|uniref:TetR/AcrR family transcriptional regulator n=1 Tax=Oceanobacillus kapialis TaxID=481353 RepID=A0ABW5Q3A0_9BACI